MFDSFSDVIDCLLRHSYQKSISMVLDAILTEIDCTDYEQPFNEQIDFYQQMIMKSLVKDLGPNRADEINLNALAVIKNSIESPVV
jgi:hypothetical protein